MIFCDREYIDERNLQSEIRNFYEDNHQTDEIFVIGPNYNEQRLKEIFVDKQLETFKDIPKPERDHLRDNLYLFTFDKIGSLSCSNRGDVISQDAVDCVLRHGLVNIFVSRGGLIEATGQAHHFVFPSGKHCNKFLRTGNILLHSSEIFFIAFNLLKRLDEVEHEQIFCDTSSINALAFALLELKRKLVGEAYKMIPIESFSSYEGLFSKSKRYFGRSLILVSSSTSGNIISKIIKHDEKVEERNIVILYFLGSEKDYLDHRANIICNLTKKKTNGQIGLEYYDTYTEKNCIYCEKGSYPVEVKGDVFLLEKPKINRITIKVTDAPPRLSDFVKQFKSTKRAENNIFKVNYKQSRDTNNKYEVYFDMYQVLCDLNLEGGRYKKYREKLYDFINQYIPGNTKYLISLPDEGSEKLTDLIIQHLKPNYKSGKLPKAVKFGELKKELNNEKISGAAVIVASCISNGKNLLYLSRTLRSFNKLKLIYFVGLTRTNNSSNLEFLKANLKQGLYGRDTNSFVEVESFYCTNESKKNSWIREVDFLKSLQEFSEEKQLNRANSFFKKRIELLENSMSSQVKGLANGLFFGNLNDEELLLRKNFAFFNFGNYVNDVSQADVYFTVSSVLNRLRNSDDQTQCLKQSEFVRNVIDPGNFNRFNDGIIQACILRAGKNSELAYHIDDGLSSDMRDILEKIIEFHDSPQGEALIEFLYAIACEKLTLRREHLHYLSKKMEGVKSESELVKLLCLFINEKILVLKDSLHNQISQVINEKGELKEELNVEPDKLKKEQKN